MEVLEQLYQQHFQSPVARIQPLQGELGGSGRRIIRLTGQAGSAIGILYNGREENVAFLEFSRHFRKSGLPVPQIYGEALDQDAYLEEDLGDTTLFEFLSKHRTGDEIAPAAVEAYRKVVGILPRFQVEGGRGLDYRVCYPRGSFDRQSINWDLNYFKYYFLRLAGVPFNEQGLEDDFTQLTDFLLTAEREFFLYRDFQSRNIMLVGAARCSMTSRRCCMTAKPICRQRCGSNCSTTIWTHSQRISGSIAPPFCTTTTRMSTSAFCRRWVRMVSADSMSARRISCRAFPTR
jgi:hypothetical protein